MAKRQRLGRGADQGVSSVVARTIKPGHYRWKCPKCKLSTDGFFDEKPSGEIGVHCARTRPKTCDHYVVVQYDAGMTAKRPNYSIDLNAQQIECSHKFVFQNVINGNHLRFLCRKCWMDGGVDLNQEGITTLIKLLGFGICVDLSCFDTVVRMGNGKVTYDDSAPKRKMGKMA